MVKSVLPMVPIIDKPYTEGMAFEFRLLSLLHFFDDSSSCNLLVITGRGLHSSGKESNNAV
jgi:hypothetical protein